MKASTVLKKALKKLGPNGELWVNRAPRKGEHCCGTAIGRFSSPEGMLARRYFLRAIGWRASTIAEWNDARCRTFPQVKEAFEKAIRSAEQQEAKA